MILLIKWVATSYPCFSRSTNSILVYLFAFFFINTLTLYPCDVCNIYDYNGRQNQSYIGLFYRYRLMNGYNHISPTTHRFFVANPGGRIDHDISGSHFYHEKNNLDFQRFQTMDVRANIAIKEKVNMGMIAPLLLNQAYYNKIYYESMPVTDSTISTQGLGDLVLYSDYIITKDYQKSSCIFKPGFAIKLPTGNSTIGNNGTLFPHELQNGTGTFDFILRLNANLKHKNWGLEILNNYRINTSNSKRSYKFGNSYNISINPFRTISVNENCIFIPKIGTYAELSSSDKSNHEKIDYTGGFIGYLNFGADLTWKSWVLQVLIQKPLIQHLNGEQLGTGGRLTSGLLFNF